MKKDVICIYVLNVISLIMLMIFNATSLLMLTFNVLLLTIGFLVAINKKISLYILIEFILILSSLYMIAFVKIGFLLLVFYFLIIAFLSVTWQFVFNLHNNSMNLQFKNLKMPNNDYIVGKIINCSIGKSNSNILVQREDNNLLLQTESLSEIVKLKIKFDDIKKIEIIKKPYNKSVTKYDNYDVDYSKSYAVGHIMGNFDTHNGIKIIPSYEVKIITEKENIVLIFFDNPYIFENITDYSINGNGKIGDNYDK